MKILRQWRINRLLIALEGAKAGLAECRRFNEGNTYTAATIGKIAEKLRQLGHKVEP